MEQQQQQQQQPSEVETAAASTMAAATTVAAAEDTTDNNSNNDNSNSNNDKKDTDNSSSHTAATAAADDNNNNSSSNSTHDDAAAAAVVSPQQPERRRSSRRCCLHRPNYSDDKKEEETAAATTSSNSSSITIGQVFYKQFDGEDGDYFEGRVVSGPEEVLVRDDDDDDDDGSNNHNHTSNNNKPEQHKVVRTWRVRYADDGQEEDLTAEEIAEWPREEPSAPHNKSNRKKRARTTTSSKSAASSSSSSSSSQLLQQKQYARARQSLRWLPGIRADEADDALQAIGPPYGLQAAVDRIHAVRRDPDHYYDNDNGGGDSDNDQKKKFAPHVGLQVRMSAGGAQYFGQVTSEGRMMEVDDDLGQTQRLRMWEVTYEDGSQDDLDWYQLLQSRADRPVRTHPGRGGRMLGCLELFAGCGMVSQCFAERRWLVRSVDNDVGRSNASDRVDIMQFELLRDVSFVPDFIWASPPCFTYSIMAGGRHRTVETRDYEKTREARQHNHIFAKMAKVLHQAKARHPHLIVVIENPVGLLAKMPLMAELEQSLGLYRTTVDYCAFGRSDKKPTHLWTNDYGLHATLSEFKCANRCPYKDGVHPISARKQGNQFNAAAIPEALAEEVAEYVHAKFVLDRIRYTKEVAVPSLPEEGGGGGGGDGTNTVTSSEGVGDSCS